MNTDTVMVIRSSRITLVTPISIQAEPLGVISVKFFVYTNEGYEICFSIASKLPHKFLLPGGAIYEFLNKLLTKIINGISDEDTDIIHINNSDIYYLIESDEEDPKDNELNSVGVVVTYLKSSINPSLPILNGLK